MVRKQDLRIEDAWNNWVECLIGKDQNSIFNQIYRMIWDTSIFRVVVESRKNKIEKNSEKPELNGALHSFIDRNYFQSQCLYIRRIIDPSYEIRGEKGVFSLGALIKDLKRFHLELTREKYLILLGKPYDYTEIQKKNEDYLKTHHNCIVPSEYDWWTIEEAHQFFDRLSGVPRTKRAPENVISEHVFTRLAAKLKSCDSIMFYARKYIAHSASPKNRTIIDNKESRITFNQVWKAQKEIFEVADFLSTALFQTGHMALPLENHNVYHYWDKPMVERDEVGLVRSALKSYREETKKWSEKAVDNVWNWIEET
jgi:hypothetical protein